MEGTDKKIMRYSDEELQEFKAIILEKLAKAKENLETLTEAFANNASEASDTAPTFKVLEEGASIRSKEDNANLAARQQKFIKDLEAALLRERCHRDTHRRNRSRSWLPRYRKQGTRWCPSPWSACAAWGYRGRWEDRPA